MRTGRAPQPGPATRTSLLAPTHPAHRWVGVALVAVSAASFGTVAIFARIAYEAGGEPVAVLLARFVLASVVLVALMAAGRYSWPRGRILVGLVGLGGIGYVGQSLTFFSALTLASAGLVSLLLYLFPAVVLGLSVLFLGERLTPAKVVALVLAVTGSALTIGAAGGGRPLGIVLGVASALIYSGYIVIGSRITPAAGVLPATTVIICTAAVVYAGIAAVTRPAFPTGALGALALVGLALVATVLALITFYAGMARLGPSDTSTLSTLEPVVTVVLAAAVLGETVTAGQLVGGALILSAVLVLARARS